MNIEKEKMAIERLRAFEPETEPYYLCYSGGKDSDVIRILAALAGVRHEIHHNHTTVDAPETVRYVRSIPGVIIHHPELTMWELIVKKKRPPTFQARYCCSELKEPGGKGRLKVTGVRWAESANRKNTRGLIDVVGKPKTMQREAESRGIEHATNKKGNLILTQDNDEARRFVEYCYRTTSTTLNPIVDWTDDDVWQLLHYYGCPSNPLYQCGQRRVGCVGCPLTGSRRMKEDFARYPAYRRAYIRAFDAMLAARTENRGESDWKTGEDVMRWWLRDDP